MKRFKYEHKIEIGIDEAGRGCMAGPVYAAAGIWPRDANIDSSMIKDSKNDQKKWTIDLKNLSILLRK